VASCEDTSTKPTHAARVASPSTMHTAAITATRVSANAALASDPSTEGAQPSNATA